ncbi:MAG TPA: choice-of-anchor tandem repeat NxxGxxAF-containing protein [bacterium]|nr:choice-of-anchor tandem repeat NxxGxxAF-containing protein [bacterium]
MTRLGYLLVVLALFAAPARSQPAGPPALVSAAVPASAPRPDVARAVFLTGQAAPNGGTFTEFSDPALNDRGDLVFAALTTSAAAHDSIYLRAGGHTTALASTGQPAPTGGTFEVFNDVVLNDRDTVVFLARTSDRTARQGLYLARAGTIAPIVAVGQPAPSGGLFSDFANPTINVEDTVAFVGRMTQGAQEGIFVANEGSITALVLSGQRAPGGGRFQFFLDGSPAQNDHGQIAFVASTAPRVAFGVYVLVGTRPVPVVTTDDDAPVGGPFTEFGFVNLTGAGTVGFVGRTVRSTVREAYYVTGLAQLVALARQGEAASGDVLTTFVNSVMNEREEVVFELGTPSPIPRGIYLATRAGVRAVVRAGDPTPSGARFTAFDAPALNGRGQIAFVAESDDGRHGIYLVTPR